MGKDVSKVTTTFQFCDGGSCKKAKSELAVREARAYLRNENLWDTTHTIRTRCNGRCEDAPTWIVQPGNFWYKNLTPEKAIEIVESHTKTEEPIKEYLLYKEGDEQLNTDNEKTIPPVFFKSKEDAEFGAVLVARASASDQYIYPVFQKLFNTENTLDVFYNNEEYHITEIHSVSYSDLLDVEVTGNNINFKLAVGPITKAMEQDVDATILDRKVGVSEVIWFNNNEKHLGTIRLKNRKGKHLITFYIRKENPDLWNYILEIYLKMDITNPRILHEA